MVNDSFAMIGAGPSSFNSSFYTSYTGELVLRGPGTTGGMGLFVLRVVILFIVLLVRSDFCFFSDSESTFLTDRAKTFQDGRGVIFRTSTSGVFRFFGNVGIRRIYVRFLDFPFIGRY